VITRIYIAKWWKHTAQGLRQCAHKSDGFCAYIKTTVTQKERSYTFFLWLTQGIQFLRYMRDNCSINEFKRGVRVRVCWWGIVQGVG